MDRPDAAGAVGTYAQGRRSALTRRLSVAFGLAWVALPAWWIAAGAIFQAEATNEGARGALALVVLVILVDLGYRLYRRRPSMLPPGIAG